ncbi:Uncharacterised protein [Chlamydia abortus]|nr:Uncharacterised protein [Chlamydia abortus]SGA30656.1 Uncharacterised protein [Chlamydia abortus]SGA31288.1 Uncharacterised protein [Chlamydia abortus]
MPSLASLLMGYCLTEMGVASALSSTTTGGTCLANPIPACSAQTLGNAVSQPEETAFLGCSSCNRYSSSVLRTRQATGAFPQLTCGPSEVNWT